MQDFVKKFRFIFIPFLLMMIATVAIYTFFHWFLFIKTTAFNVDEDILNFWVPFTIPWIPILIWLRPRVKLLNLKNKSGKGDPLGGYLFVAWIIIAAPTLVAQSYIVTATGELTKLNTINDIGKQPLTKYYALNHFYIDKHRARLKVVFEVSGKHNENFDMTIYIPCPIFDQADTISYNNPPPVANQDTGLNVQAEPTAWLAIKYQETISNNLSSDGKQAAFDHFRDRSQKNFDTRSLNDFVYLDRLSYSSDLRNYTSAITSKKYNSHDNPLIILLPVNESFDARNGNKLAWIFGSIGIGAVVFLITLLFKPLKRDVSETDIIKEREKAGMQTMSLIKNLFSAKGDLKTTRILIGINLMMFVIMVFSGLGFISFSGEDLLKWGANYRPSIQNGEYWRLITCMFLHGGIMHILFNMYGLFIAGLFLEKEIGPKWFAILYLLTGIVASITSVCWHPATVSVGASGAIFGVYGVLFALLTTNVFPTATKKPMLIYIGVFIGYNLLYGLAGGIDNAAHVGGLLSGLALGYMIYAFFKDQLVKQPKMDHQHLVDELNAKSIDDVTA